MQNDEVLQDAQELITRQIPPEHGSPSTDRSLMESPGSACGEHTEKDENEGPDQADAGPGPSSFAARIKHKVKL